MNTLVLITWLLSSISSLLIVRIQSFSHPRQNRSCNLNLLKTKRNNLIKMVGGGDTEDNNDKNLKVVIAGAGVIGTSTAYYLSKNHPSCLESITVIDPTGSIAPAASGKAGGFLALDWNDHSPLGPLARRSFDLHQELANTFGSDTIMYRRLTCASVSVDQLGNQKRPSGKKLEGIEWVDDVATRIRPLGDENTIAQVHPKMLCDAMWSAVQECKDISSSLVNGKIIGPIYGGEGIENKSLIGAKLDDGTTIDADVILYACGPWTEYGNCMLGVKYHSAIIPTRPRVLNQSVFFDGFGDPEVYPRPDGTAYCTGFPDPAIRVTDFPGKEEVREEAIQTIVNAVRGASGSKDGGALGEDPELKQSCYLPTTLDGMPMIGEISDEKGCYVAAGHGCWGILLGPATGEAMASCRRMLPRGDNGSSLPLSQWTLVISMISHMPAPASQSRASQAAYRMPS